MGRPLFIRYVNKEKYRFCHINDSAYVWRRVNSVGKTQVYNPYLPLDTYIPDGEPHVFEDRVYIYGSHDAEGGDCYCLLDYECWSAPVNDLTAWRNEGIIYRAEQCRHYSKERQDMYAPDVVRGNDGRYYLYYDLSGRGDHGFDGPISVAVCDEPAGQYEYYGDVQYPDGRPLLRYIPFDPAVLNDNGHIYLTYGWGLGVDTHSFPLRLTMPNVMSRIFNKSVEEIKSEEPDSILGANLVELQDDMLTVKSEPVRIFPAKNNTQKGSEVRKHSFYEGASLRKFGDLYYFIYSSHVNHELCYATSRFPDRDYTYRGVIVSNGDIGMNGRKPKDRLAATGTNHGSIECINGRYYIFYHRLTHASAFSRQGCAEPIEITENGKISQVEMTSCGLNGEPLNGKGTYPAAICCNLTNGNMPHIYKYAAHPIPNINHEGSDRFVKGMTDGTLAGYKYFLFNGNTGIRVRTRGANGKLIVMSDTKEPLAELALDASDAWKESDEIEVHLKGKCPLYFLYQGRGEIDFLEFSLS
ncbi:MAG: family 43 glycosylhydrolase [Lachnospiraceae bacterium]|nr:family 43 glycosylhydrolase [Lachnospiraceae bacterium]